MTLALLIHLNELLNHTKPLTRPYFEMLVISGYLSYYMDCILQSLESYMVTKLQGKG